MGTVTLHTIHVGAPENYTKSNNTKKLLTELRWEIDVMERRNVTAIFANIIRSKSTYYLLYDKSHSKTRSTDR